MRRIELLELLDARLEAVVEREVEILDPARKFVHQLVEALPLERGVDLDGDRERLFARDELRDRVRPLCQVECVHLEAAAEQVLGDVQLRAPTRRGRARRCAGSSAE